MYKINRKATLDDGCNPELVANALFDGTLEIPSIKAHKHIFIPNGITPFSCSEKTKIHQKKLLVSSRWMNIFLEF